MRFTNSMRAIELLKKYASAQTRYKRTVELDEGQEFVFYHQPLTMAEQEAVLARCKSSESNEFAIQLLIAKAQDDKGNALFAAGDFADLKHMIRRSKAEEIIGCLMREDTENEVDLDMKSGEDTVQKGKKTPA